MSFVEGSKAECLVLRSGGVCSVSFSGALVEDGSSAEAGGDTLEEK